MGLILSLLHLCLFMSPSLLKYLPHSLHCTAWSSSPLCLLSFPPGASSLAGDRELLFMVEHLCTARPPLLRNHLLQCGHWTDPDCWETGSIRSLVHLCLALSASLLKYLPHTLHSTDLISCCCLLDCSCWCWYSATPLLYISYHMFLLCAASNQLPAPTSRTVKSFLTTSLHRPLVHNVDASLVAMRKEQSWACVHLAFWQGVLAILAVVSSLWS